MSKPDLRVNAGIYTLIWQDEQIAIRIDRLHENGHHQVSGEVLVKTLLPGAATHLHQARLNLTSTTARRTLAKYLSTRMQLEWDAIVEQACITTLQAYRTGEPVVALADVSPRQGPRYRVEPLLLDGHPNHLYGDGGVGKSLLAAYLGVLVSSGFHRCGLSPLPGRVLYLDYETSAEEMRERIVMLEAGLSEATCSDIRYRFCVQPLASEIEEIQRIVNEQEIEFAIIDSMGPAVGGEKGDPKDPVIEYFRALRSLRICTLTIDHVAKAEGTRRTPYGSVYKQNLSRNVFEVRKSQETGEDLLTIGVFHRKSNFDRLQQAMGFQCTFGLGSISVERTAVQDIPELAGATTLRDQIVGALRHSAMTAQELAEELGVNQNLIRAMLSRHKGKSFIAVDQERSPHWGLLRKGEND